MAWTQEEASEIYVRAMQKAATDEEFRTKLLKNPKGTLEELTGKSLPDNYKIRVIEEGTNEDVTNTNIPTFILPKQKRNELDLDDLDRVAGGFGDCYGEGIDCFNQVCVNQSQSKENPQ
jgi:hypothetical protein